MIGIGKIQMNAQSLGRIDCLTLFSVSILKDRMSRKEFIWTDLL